MVSHRRRGQVIERVGIAVHSEGDPLAVVQTCDLMSLASRRVQCWYNENFYESETALIRSGGVHADPGSCSFCIAFSFLLLLSNAQSS